MFKNRHRYLGVLIFSLPLGALIYIGSLLFITILFTNPFSNEKPAFANTAFFFSHLIISYLLAIPFSNSLLKVIFPPSFK